MTRLPLLAALTAAGAVLAGCGSTADLQPYDAGQDSSTYDSTRQVSDVDQGDPDDFSAMIDLSDGRKVSMFYAKDRGLAEQHYSPDADAWTAPAIIYPTKTDPCQGIALAEKNGTVAVTADWNLYCYDGEPPDESIGAVGTGDLTDWDTDLTRHFDGWSKPKVAADGATVTWTLDRATLTWTPDGFDKSLDD